MTKKLTKIDSLDTKGETANYLSLYSDKRNATHGKTKQNQQHALDDILWEKNVEQIKM